MKAKISVSGTRYGTISASITFRQSGRSLFGSSSFNSGNRKRMIINLLNRGSWKICSKDAYEIEFEADVPDKLLIVIKSILKMHRVKKKDVERWEKMTLDEIYDDITLLIIASELSS